MISDTDLQKIMLWHDQIEVICKKINQVLENNGYKAVPEAENRIGDRPAEVEYSGCEFVSLKEVSELIFEKYGAVNESTMDMIGFITSKLKARKIITYHKTAAGRMYNVGDEGDSAKWLMVPESCRKDHSRDFSAQDLHFYKDQMNYMLKDLWIGNKESFDKAYKGYKDFIARVKTGGN